MKTNRQRAEPGEFTHWWRVSGQGLVPTLKKFKRLAIAGADVLELSSLVFNSSWRRDRLAILCYHGISQDDEHLWDPSLYMSPSAFRERLQTLKNLRCNVLPLGEAVRRLYMGTLPPRSVVITFDDGVYDFYSVAHPILTEFGYPVTVYYTTYYSAYNRAVFDPIVSYILWKARGRRLGWSKIGLEDVFLDEAGRARADKAVKTYAWSREMSGPSKDALAAELACRLGIDYEAINRKRLIHLIAPEEARVLANMGVDFQLHTHRHRTSRNREIFIREIADNRRCISTVTGVDPQHFCYPGGLHLPEFRAWLQEENILSATTCRLGIATAQSDPLLLPRLVDSSGISLAEFRAFITGVGEFLPRRPHVVYGGQLFRDRLVKELTSSN